MSFSINLRSMIFFGPIPSWLQFTCMMLVALIWTSATVWHELTYSDDLMGTLEREFSHPKSIILMGDSVLTSAYYSESERKRLWEYLTATTQRNVLLLSRGGMGLLPFSKILASCPTLNNKADLLIIEINPYQMLRGINKTTYHLWLKHLLVTSKEITPLKAIISESYDADKRMAQKEFSISKKTRPQGPFNRTQDLYDMAEVYSTENIGKIPPLLMQINEDSSRIAHKVLFFITPMNIKRLKLFVDDATLQGIQTRVSMIKKTFDDANIPYIDLLEAVPDSSRFPDSSEVHLDAEGCKHVAQELAKAIKHYGFLKTEDEHHKSKITPDSEPIHSDQPTSKRLEI